MKRLLFLILLLSACAPTPQHVAISSLLPVTATQFYSDGANYGLGSFYFQATNQQAAIKYNFGNWTASGTLVINGTGFYEIL